MPKSRSSVVTKVRPLVTAPRRTQPQPRATARFQQPIAVAGTTTKEADLIDWVGWFARFHADPPHYVPYAIRTFDTLVGIARSEPNDSEAPRVLRCIREVTKRELRRGVEWLLITWAIGLPGVQFERCDSLDDAMQRFEISPPVVQL